MVDHKGSEGLGGSGLTGGSIGACSPQSSRRLIPNPRGPTYGNITEKKGTNRPPWYGYGCLTPLLSTKGEPSGYTEPCTLNPKASTRQPECKVFSAGPPKLSQTSATTTGFGVQGSGLRVWGLGLGFRGGSPPKEEAPA